MHSKKLRSLLNTAIGETVLGMFDDIDGFDLLGKKSMLATYLLRQGTSGLDISMLRKLGLLVRGFLCDPDVLCAYGNSGHHDHDDWGNHQVTITRPIRSPTLFSLSARRKLARSADKELLLNR